MTLRRKLIIGVLVLLFGGLWFFEGRRVSFSLECLGAERELENNFSENKAAFLSLIPLVDKASDIDFEIMSKDSIYMSFYYSGVDLSVLQLDSSYTLYPETNAEYRVNERMCLQIIKKDTAEVCNHSWSVQFYGHYKDDRINDLLKFIEWDRQSFENLVEKVHELNCTRFSKEGNQFELAYDVVSYYHDGINRCFGHSGGYFDYLYTTEPDSFYWPHSLVQLDDNYYAVNLWNF